MKEIDSFIVFLSDDVIVAISNSGTVKVWTLSSAEKPEKEVFENESKQIRCLNAHTLRCCPYNQRTVLLVCAKFWQVRAIKLFRVKVLIKLFHFLCIY